MRFMFRWGFISSLVALGQAMRAAFTENWQDKLICECEVVESVDDCLDYKEEEDGFPPSFPRFYHHKVETSTKWVNYCCGFTSSDIKKGWRKWMTRTKNKKIPQEKGMCLQERRPLPTENCCRAEHIRGAWGDLGVVLKFGKAYSMAHPVARRSKKQEDLKYEDYASKTKLFFDLEDVYAVRNPGVDLTKAEVKDVLMDFRKRFSVPTSPEAGLLMCNRGFARLQTGQKGRCMMRRKKEDCCCPEQALPKAGMKECRTPPQGAEEKKVFFQRAKINVIRSTFWDPRQQKNIEYISKIDHKFPDLKPAQKASWLTSSLEPESKAKILWRKSEDQIASTECINWYNVTVMTVEEKYCQERKITLTCDAGKVLYEQVPGYELQDEEFACREGLKNNLKDDPDYDSRCRCT